MKTPSFHNVEQLSAFLDGQLSQAEKTRLDSRIQSDPELAAALDDLRQARALLRRTPQRRAPRNFTLTPKMAGIRPPLPRLVPVLSWASAIAMLLFVCTFGTNLLGQLPLGASAPMLAAAPADNTRSDYGIGGGPPAATEPAVNETILATITPEAILMTAPQATQPAMTQAVETPTAFKVQPEPVNPWPYIWLGLAVLLISAAFLIRWARNRAFKRKLKP